MTEEKVLDVTKDLANGYLGLGIVGGALLLVLIFMLLYMWFNHKAMNRSMNGVDKLCGKIDSLVSVVNTQMTTSYKDQKTTIELLNRILDCNLDIQRRVVRVDDRTYACRGNPSDHKEEAS